mgnify:CR=1 FL=1
MLIKDHRRRAKKGLSAKKKAAKTLNAAPPKAKSPLKNSNIIA